MSTTAVMLPTVLAAKPISVFDRAAERLALSMRLKKLASKLGDPDDSAGVCRASELLAEDARHMIEEA